MCHIVLTCALWIPWKNKPNGFNNFLHQIHSKLTRWTSKKIVYSKNSCISLATNTHGHVLLIRSWQFCCILCANWKSNWALIWCGFTNTWSSTLGRFEIKLGSELGINKYNYLPSRPPCTWFTPRSPGRIRCWGSAVAHWRFRCATNSQYSISE
jgi:hypothetical protein